MKLDSFDKLKHSQTLVCQFIPTRHLLCSIMSSFSVITDIVKALRWLCQGKLKVLDLVVLICVKLITLTFLGSKLNAAPSLLWEGNRTQAEVIPL